MVRRDVPRIGRVLDLIGLVLFLAGGATFARAWMGFTAVRAYQPTPEEGPWAAIRLADHWLRVQWAGGALMLAGVAVFLAAWWVARSSAPGVAHSAQEDDGA